MVVCLLGDKRIAAPLSEYISFQLVCKAAIGSTASVDILFFFVSMHSDEEDFSQTPAGLVCVCLSVDVCLCQLLDSQWSQWIKEWITTMRQLVYYM